MMVQLKQYNFQLLTLAPVYIGSGHTYLPKEYIHENREFYFPDMTEVYKTVRQKSEQTTKAFENYLLTARTTERLENFLKQQNITGRNFDGYKIKETGLEKSKKTKGRQLNEIESFIKNPYKEPYIPGSSLKGAIRTILANEYFRSDRVDNQFYHNIRVSDSEPLSLDDLIIVQKIDYSKPKKDTNELPLYRQALKPLTLVKFTLTVEGKEAQQVMEQLEDLSNKHYQHYKQHFLNETDQNNVQNYQRNIIYLGGGTGFWTKTIIDKARQPRGHPKMQMKGKGVYKLTRARNEKIKGESVIKNKDHLYEMGKCMFVMKSK